MQQSGLATGLSTIWTDDGGGLGQSNGQPGQGNLDSIGRDCFVKLSILPVHLFMHSSATGRGTILETPVDWNIRILEYWNIRILEYWNIRILVHWNN